MVFACRTLLPSATLPAMKVRTLIIAGALLGFSACTEEEPEDWGTIHLELQRENSAVDPFVGTSSILVQAVYGECITEFYTVSNTQYQIDGVEGAAIFEEWAGRICDSGEFPQVIDCEVAEPVLGTGFSQNFTQVPFELQLEYTVLDSASLQGADIRVGPLPTERITDGCTPTVSVNATNAVFGRDSNGNSLWQVGTTQNASSVATNQGAPARINVQAL